MSKKVSFDTIPVPADCPVELSGPPPFTPSSEHMLDTGIGLEGYWTSVPEAISSPGSSQAVRVVAGQIACGMCDYQNECSRAVSAARSSGLAEQQHPLELEGIIGEADRLALWANAAVRLKAEQGYTFGSVANMAGTIATLPSVLRNVAIGVLKTDLSAMPTEIRELEVKGVGYSMISWDFSRLIISRSALDEIEKSRGSSAQADDFIENLAVALAPSVTSPDRSMIAELMASGRGPRWIRKMNNADILEFNSSTKSTLRAFGGIFDTPSTNGQGLTTVAITSASSSAKSGSGGKATDRTSKNAERSMALLKPVITTVDGLKEAISPGGRELKERYKS